MPPLVPRNNCKQKEIWILSNVMGRINADEPIPEAPVCVHLESGLNTHNEVLPLQL